MRLHRFFVEERLENKDKIELGAAADSNFLNQIRNVLRLKVGDKMWIFDGSGYDFTARIDGYEKKAVLLSIIDKKENKVRPEKRSGQKDADIYLFASLVKKDKFEWIVEKATELGVAHIVPIISARSEKKNLNLERLKKIIIEASEQSGRGSLPVLHEVTDLPEALNNFKKIKSIAWEPSAVKFTQKDINAAQGMYVGPEGGWSEEEKEIFKKNGIPLLSLGPQILRAETAVVAGLSRVVF